MDFVCQKAIRIKGKSHLAEVMNFPKSGYWHRRGREVLIINGCVELLPPQAASEMRRRSCPAEHGAGSSLPRASMGRWH